MTCNAHASRSRECNEARIATHEDAASVITNEQQMIVRKSVELASVTSLLTRKTGATKYAFLCIEMQ